MKNSKGAPIGMPSNMNGIEDGSNIKVLHKQLKNENGSIEINTSGISEDKTNK